jgi:DNA-binding transcriptional MerR regulator
MKVTWTQEEVCSLTGLEPHILRFWEGEFPQLRPRRNSAGQRVYRERDVDIVTRLKGWIYDEGLAIPAARRRLKEDFESLTQAPPDPEQLGMPFLEVPTEPSAPAPAVEPVAAVAPVPVAVAAPPAVPAAPEPVPPPPAPAKIPEPSLFFEPAAVPSPVPSAPTAPSPGSAALRRQLLEVLSLLEAP